MPLIYADIQLYIIPIELQNYIHKDFYSCIRNPKEYKYFVLKYFPRCVDFCIQLNHFYSTFVNPNDISRFFWHLNHWPHNLFLTIGNKIRCKIKTQINSIRYEILSTDESMRARIISVKDDDPTSLGTFLNTTGKQMGVYHLELIVVYIRKMRRIDIYKSENVFLYCGNVSLV